MSDYVSIHGQWSSRLTFILAATGAAVGLGNVWKFPYLVGENGGGAFVLVYIASIALIGVPVMIAEVMIGRRGRQSPINTLRDLAVEAKSNCRWQFAGVLGIVAGLIITSYYSVIAGWTMAYAVRMVGGVFTGVTKDGAESIFAFLVEDPERMLAWHTLFILMTVAVISRGVRSGLEQAVKILMPALLLLLLALVVYAAVNGDFVQGLRFMFAIDFDALTTGGVLTAMGHAFFTLSLGAGAIMVYGSYLPSDVPIARTVVAIATFDTVIALLAGLAVFPLVFANGLTPGSGPGLIFLSLPSLLATCRGEGSLGRSFSFFFCLQPGPPRLLCWSRWSPGWWRIVGCCGLGRRAGSVFLPGCWGWSRSSLLAPGPLSSILPVK